MISEKKKSFCNKANLKPFLFVSVTVAKLCKTFSTWSNIRVGTDLTRKYSTFRGKNTLAYFKETLVTKKKNVFMSFKPVDVFVVADWHDFRLRLLHFKSITGMKKKIFANHQIREPRKLTGDSLKVVWVEFQCDQNIELIFSQIKE